MLDGATVESGTGGGSPTLVSNPDVYSFSGDTSSSARFIMSDSVKQAVMSLTDNFSTSMWIKIPPQETIAYAFSFETEPVSANHRFYSWLMRQNRLNVFYNRGQIPGTAADNGINTRVGMSFYYSDETLFPEGTIHDNQWHFLKLDVNFPNMILYVDGHAIMCSEGHFFNAANAKQDLVFPFDMPAAFATKDSSTINNIIARLGGSSRSNDAYNIEASMRLMYITGLMNNNQYSCIASCNNSLIPIGFVPGSGSDLSNTYDGFDVFYQPVTRSLEFQKAGSSPEEYTNFVRSLVYNTRNGSITPEEQGEGRRVTITVSCHPQLKG